MLGQFRLSIYIRLRQVRTDYVRIIRLSLFVSDYFRFVVVRSG